MPDREAISEAERAAINEADRAAITEAERAVLELITLDEIREIAVDLVQAVGQNPPGEEGPTVDVLAGACEARSLTVTTTEVEPGRSNLSAVLAGGPGPGLLLLGHTDVVPVGDNWTVPPFGGEVRDGRLFGRGSADMKGGLAACVVALSALRRAGVALSGPVELAAVVDEEETGKGVRAYLAGGDRSGLAGCIVAEPTDLQTIIAARGDSYVEIAVTGRAAHSGKPSDGLNAIYGAAAVVTELERWHGELSDARHPLVGAATWSVGQIAGGTGTSTVPAECLITADRRLLPGEQGSAVLAETAARIEALRLGERGLGVEVTMTMQMPGFETAPDHRLVVLAERAVRDAGGPDLPLGGWTAACDGGFVARDAGVPVIVLGPGSVAEQAHRADESVGLDELLMAARVYALCAMRLLTG
ncbi:M20 family metallopeptidase [Nonomuraea sp. K274]|uniref:Probable succinyl-diaminopimelate desuccinylase n=1 Tax=Nonomuraea cypriaca TaxID=1187855 RepID=A0A931EWS6_9ACTN|nr:M20 family metallopeptidase [Nonomuraea cypriaca]MBF8184762.1 M20 family metallopeptidase [Nonomuraea cypriaca]